MDYQWGENLQKRWEQLTCDAQHTSSYLLELSGPAAHTIYCAYNMSGPQQPSIGPEITNDIAISVVDATGIRRVFPLEGSLTIAGVSEKCVHVFDYISQWLSAENNPIVQYDTARDTTVIYMNPF